ncbi:MAG: hypothetical protein EXR71_05340 [Myxococcales bacterium]|nr:hypothetical protein [Myxococcales bacterium]
MDALPGYSPPAETNPFAIASLILGVVGTIVYCCGSFLCLGWLGFFLWFAGAICGVVALVQKAEGNSKIMAWVGLALNLVFLLAAFGLGMVFMGLGAMSEMAGQM